MERIYYPIDEKAAKMANDMTFLCREYQEGEKTAYYHSKADEVYELAETQIQKVSDHYHGKIESLAISYAKRLAANINRRSSIDGRTPSMLIAGPAGINPSAIEKANEARGSSFEELEEIEKIKDKILSCGTGGISSDEENAAELIQEKINRLETSHKEMKAANAWYRKHKSLKDCPISEELMKEAVSNIAWSSQYGDPRPFSSNCLSLNKASIKRLKQRLADLERRSEFTGWSFDGGSVEANLDGNRVQIFYDEKPDEETRSILKKHGFRWSPRNEVWQRQLNANGIRAAKEVTGINN